jgi:disulfide bond formation protein DsbB
MPKYFNNTFFLNKLLIPLGQDFWSTLNRWQNQRPLWLLGGLSAFFLEIFSILFFQFFLELQPCDFCVRIRFCMITLFLGSLVALIKPSSFFLKLPAYGLCLYSAIFGLCLTIQLEIINLNQAYNTQYTPFCKPGQVVFPFKLPLYKWLPNHFSAPGVCGSADSSWSLWGFSMSEWLMMIYTIYILGLLLMLISYISGLILKRQTTNGLSA